MTEIDPTLYAIVIAIMGGMCGALFSIALYAIWQAGKKERSR